METNFPSSDSVAPNPIQSPAAEPAVQVGTRVSSEVPVQMFREILFLPLRLERQEDKDMLAEAVSKLPLQGWTKVEDNLTSVGRSKIWRPEVKKNSEGVPLPDQETDSDFIRRNAYSEAAYFHPFVQQFLYGFGKDRSTPAALDTYERADLETMTVRMGYGSEGLFQARPEADNFEIELVIERVHCHHIREPGMLFLCVELAAKEHTPLVRYDKDWKPLEGKATLTLAEVLALKDGLRRTFPPYFKRLIAQPEPTVEWNTGQFPKSVKLKGQNVDIAFSFDAEQAQRLTKDMVDEDHLPVVNWWRNIFHPIGIEQKWDGPLLKLTGDDRMPSLSYVAVPDFKQILPEDHIRLCFADYPGKGMPYDPGFLQDFEQGHCYDRFRHFGTRYLISSYSMVMVVATGSLAPTPGDCFVIDTLQEHMRRHYFRLMLMVHINKTGVLAFSSWLTAAMHKHGSLRSNHYRQKVQALRRAFLEFSQITWFSNVSNQEQARELYDELMRHSGTAALYDEVAREQEHARSELSEIDNERQTEAGATLNAIALVATIIGAIMAFAAVPNVISKAETLLDGSRFLLALAAGFGLAGALGLMTSAKSFYGRTGWPLLQTEQDFENVLAACKRPAFLVPVLSLAAGLALVFVTALR